MDKNTINIKINAYQLVIDDLELQLEQTKANKFLERDFKNMRVNDIAFMCRFLSSNMYDLRNERDKIKQDESEGT